LKDLYLYHTKPFQIYNFLLKKTIWKLLEEIYKRLDTLKIKNHASTSNHNREISNHNKEILTLNKSHEETEAEEDT
jgi:hypothetical protein